MPRKEGEWNEDKETLWNYTLLVTMNKTKIKIGIFEWAIGMIIVRKFVRKVIYVNLKKGKRYVIIVRNKKVI